MSEIVFGHSSGTASYNYQVFICCAQCINFVVSVFILFFLGRVVVFTVVAVH